MVDWQGVSIEQAISYHFYNYVRFQDAEAMFRECGSPLPPEIFERVESMTTFLAHATKPNGAWNCLGDSTDDPNERERLDNTDAGFALSRGAKGIRPGNRFAIYHSGYIFGRTGWGETRPFDQEAYYSLRFGPGRMIHGHNDHTSVTYASRGRDFLVDGGFHGYTQDKWRDHLRNPSAHNVVYTTDQANFYWNAHTKLSEFQIESTWQNYKLVDTPYHRTERTRSVFFIQEPIEAMLVLDHLKGPTRNYEQVWHFDQAISLTNDHGIIKASTDGACATIQQLWPYDSIAIVEGQNEPPQGWAGYGTFDLRPIPTLLTAGSGGNVAFLTAIVIHEGEIPQISQRPVRRDEVTRNISIQVGSKKITISIMNNNTMKLASKEN